MIPLNVSGPFHTALSLALAAEQLGKTLQSVRQFYKMQVPVRATLRLR